MPDWAAVLWEPWRYIGLYGGRGGGKSHAVAMSLVLQAAERPMRVLCARETQKSIRDSVKRLLSDCITMAGLDSFYTQTDTEIRGRNGSLFVFSGLRLNVASIKSLEGLDLAWVEEASTMSQSSLETLIPTLRKAGSRLVFSWNPDLPTDPVDVLFRGPNKPPDAIAVRVNHDMNPWFPDVLMKSLEWDKQRDVEKYKHVWLGDYRANSAAAVFKRWRVEECEPPVGATFRYGADFGYALDPNVLVRCWVEGNQLFVDYAEYQVGCEIEHTPDMFMRVPGSEKWPMVCDSARPETISYLRRHGFPHARAAVKGPNSIVEGVEFLKSYDIIVHPRCVELIDDLTHYSYKVDPLTGSVLPILDEHSADGIDALRYALEGVRRAAPVAPPVVSIPTVKAAWNR